MGYNYYLPSSTKWISTSGYAFNGTPYVTSAMILLRSDDVSKSALRVNLTVALELLVGVRRLMRSRTHELAVWV